MCQAPSGLPRTLSRGNATVPSQGSQQRAESSARNLVRRNGRGENPPLLAAGLLGGYHAIQVLASMERSLLWGREQAMPEPSGQPVGEVTVSLSRELRLFDLVMMGVGMMIGAGAVLGMGDSVRIAGPGGTLVAFALNGLLAMAIAMAYAEMSSAIPRAGSIYNFARIALGRPTGFMAGWVSWFASSVAGSLYASLFGIYVVHYLGQLGLLGWMPLPVLYQERATGVVAAAFFVYVNYRGVSETGKAQNLLTLGQMLALVLVAAAGLVVVVRDPGRLLNFQPFLPHGWGAVMVCMGFEFVAFEGFEVIATAGDEAIEPRRTLPRAILWSVPIVSVIYVSVGFALIVGIGDVGTPAWEWLGGQGEKAFGAAMARLMPLGGLVATLTVIFAATSALNATTYAATRAAYALGRDRMLPELLGGISSRRRTPHVALACTAVIVLVIAALLPIIHVAASASILFLFMFLLANVCVLKLRRNMADELTYGYKMPLLPLLPVVAIVVQLALAAYIVNVSWVAWVVAPAWVLAGAALYAGYSRHHALPIREEILTLEETPAPATQGYRILVPVVDPASAIRLAGPVLRIAEAQDAGVELLHMVSIPDQVPLSDAALYAVEGREAIAEATLYLSGHVPVSASIRYCRSPVRGILAEVRRRRADLVVLSSSAGRRPQDRLLGTTASSVLSRAPCDIVVFRDCGQPPYHRVLMLLGDRRNDRLALEVASILVEREKGELIVLQVTRPGEPPRDVESFVEDAALHTRCPRERLTLNSVTARDATQAALEAAVDCDVIVLGAMPGTWWLPRRGSGLAESLVSLSSKPLVLVRAARGVRSALERWL